MKLSKLVASVAVLAVLPAAAQAQQVSVNYGSGSCPGSPPNSYNWWFGIASGIGCDGNGSGGGASNVLEWTYLDGAQPFNGMFFTGYGQFSIELLYGGDVLYTGNFESWGENVPVTVPEFQGLATTVRVRRLSGIGAFGLGDAGLVPGPVQKLGGGPGPQGNGPNGNGPPGNGPDGNGPPGNGPGGNNGNHNGWDNNNNNQGAQGGDDEDPPFSGDDDLNVLVNETNAAPEPATILLVASGLGGVGAMVRRRRKQNTDS